MLARRLLLPIEAGQAIRQTIGILDDHGATDQPTRATLLEYQVWQAWSNNEWEAMVGPEREIELEIEDAALLLEGLAFTEAMSVDLPWFDMVQWTVDFMTQQLRPAWTEEEWTTYAGG